MLRRVHRDERGVAMVMAILVAFVVLTLSIYMIDQAVRNQSNAGYDRKRLMAVNAAEAGLNWFFNKMENTEVDYLQQTPYTGEVISGPNSVSYTVTPTYYANTGGTVAFSGTPSATNYPKSMKIVSVGTASDGTQRTMESFMVLHPVYGGYEGAMIANSTTTFSNNFTVSGNNGNDGDILVLNGNFTAPSGLETIKGNIYVSAPGATAFIGTGLHVYGSVWANGGVTINHSQALVDIDAKSTSGGVTVSNGSVLNDAYYCTGGAPANVAGSKIQTCDLGSPPSTTFPQVKFDQTAWESSGYYVKTFSGATACTAARSYIEGSGASDYRSGAGVPAGSTGVVVRITDTCTYSNSNNAVVSIGSDLAIVTNGGISLGQRSEWNGASTTRDLHFISAWPTAGAPSCPTQNVSVGQFTKFNNLVQTSVYSPCTVTMSNNNSTFYGQVIGTTLTVGNLFNMAYRPVLIPGAKISGFSQDIAYIREAQNA